MRFTWIPVFALSAFLALSGGAQAAPKWMHLGEEFLLSESIPIRDLIADSELYFNRQVRIEGIVASACTNEGCFIEVVPENGGEGVVVNFPELVHLFPTDCAGAHAVVEGMFYRKVYPAARLAHWQGHSFRAGKPVPEFSLIHRVTARAVSLSNDKVPVPPALDIPPAETDRLDLANMEFEAEGFGAGRKVLAAGDSTETHPSGKTREMIFCLEGTLTVIRPGHAQVDLGPSTMTYIPPATHHAIRNLSDQPAVYIFVYSKAPEPAPVDKPHEH
jgi:mannose-6-phosphate isomerase-like protein (cupin superfamily)